MHMRCAWQAYLNILPVWMRQEVDRLGKHDLQELRLRLNQKPELITGRGTLSLNREAAAEDMQYIINVASRYSPWTAVTSAQGYITAPGGHRIGLCGAAVIADGQMTGIREPSSMCVRVARDFPGISSAAAALSGSVLIIGRPGSGKTTLLRDIIRQRSDNGTGSIAVIDEREEIFPRWNHQSCFPGGKRTDVLSGCNKAQGIEAVLRCMNPEMIAVDEITAKEDCEALLHAGWCGVNLLATAHAGSRADLLQRPVYRPIVESRLFSTLIILQKDKSWRAERMDI